MPTKLPRPVPSLAATISATISALVGRWLLRLSLVLAGLAERLMLGRKK
jgi:hypothetical protein